MPLRSGFLYGPPPPLPRRLDALAEGWARLPPRARLIVWGLLAVVVAGQCSAYRDGLLAQWGGGGIEVWQATRTITPGEDVADAVRRVRLPPIAVPPDPVTEIDPDMTLTLPLMDGAVLTEAHISSVGPAAVLPAEHRLLPVPVETAWGIDAGAVVDVWAVDRSRGPPELLSEGLRVLAVDGEGSRSVALVAVPSADVGEATSAMSSGQLLLTLVPPE
ncbi:hypothetical protein DVS28_a3995 [Euzebya pacifica]|uniref:SAF domain-containing protein n=1 Tax=Euzebya pacifica TaxID=1608957 RepID=A0A346Y2G7_9ACTN|nr:hypothetical protein [Euzebya pacifica]AXV08664.1 hypothetical protein DVS28_a3995 [Euzebya pacifica]